MNNENNTSTDKLERTLSGRVLPRVPSPRENIVRTSSMGSNNSDTQATEPEESYDNNSTYNNNTSQYNNINIAQLQSEPVVVEERYPEQQYQPEPPVVTPSSPRMDPKR